VRSLHRAINFDIDDAGKRVAIVSLPRGRSVTLYKIDLDLLLGLGLSPIWHYRKDKGVVAWLKKWRRWGSLARLIADAGPGTNVLFKDGNDDHWFLPTSTAIAKLNSMEERPWPIYKGRGMTAEHLATLLREWKIAPERNTKQARGYHVASFIEPWKRAVKLEKPEWMKQYY
jgi:hypothetical protein